MTTLAALEHPSEDELIARVLAGEVAAFEPLMRRYNQRLYRMVRAIVRNEAEAEDVLQDAYVAAYQHLAGFARRASFATWLGRIAIHAALKRQRRRRRWAPLDGEGGEGAAGPVAVSRAADPEQEAARAELRQRLEAAVDRLPARYRTVVMLRDVEEMTTDEAARCLRLTRLAVKLRLHRARALLRRELGPAVESARGRIFEFPAPRCRRLCLGVLRRLSWGEERAESRG